MFMECCCVSFRVVDTCSGRKHVKTFNPIIESKRSRVEIVTNEREQSKYLTRTV